MVTSEIYPDSSDTSSSGTDQVKIAYNVDGTRSQKTDQRGTVIQYGYNGRRQMTLERVTTLGGATDGHVQSIGRGYDNLARLTLVTSYSGNNANGDIRSQVQILRNSFGQVTTNYQSHEGAVNTSTSLKVQYAYDTTKSGTEFTRGHRPTSTTYPNSRVVFNDYGTSTSVSSLLSRVAKLRNANSSGTIWSAYDYNGMGRLAIVDYPEIDVKLDYFQGTAGTYAGYDRFGRVKDQYWDGYGMTADVDRFRYGYDYAGSRTFRDIDDAIYNGPRDQMYSYDGLHRLKTFDQGHIVSGSISSPTAEEDWGLDALGNWKTFVKKTSGSTTLDQTRHVNTANEFTKPDMSTDAFVNTVGGTWANPTYDAAGNLTDGPLGASSTTRPIKYDAWNRVVEVKQDSTVLEQYEYDGLNRRIVRTISPATTNTVLHSYYNEDWQELEVRQEVSGSQDPDPLEQFIWHPYYIDALVTRFYDSDVTDMTGPVQHYYTHDANFNITAAINTSSAVVERYEYTPYGQVTFLDSAFANPSGSSAIAQRYLYTGRCLDAGGLYHYRNRQYDPKLGNFISRDPFGYDGGDENLYGYVKNHVITLTDPFGLVVEPEYPSRPCLECDKEFDLCKNNVTVKPALARFAKVGNLGLPWTNAKNF